MVLRLGGSRHFGEDCGGTSLAFYLKNHHCWVIHFENGKVAKTEVF